MVCGIENDPCAIFNVIHSHDLTTCSIIHTSEHGRVNGVPRSAPYTIASKTVLTRGRRCHGRRSRRRHRERLYRRWRESWWRCRGDRGRERRRCCWRDCSGCRRGWHRLRLHHGNLTRQLRNRRLWLESGWRNKVRSVSCKLTIHIACSPARTHSLTNQ